MTASLTTTVDMDEMKELLDREFARSPSLLDEAHELIGQRFFTEECSLFDYLFVPATRIADGTNNEIVGFRLRDPQERLLTLIAALRKKSESVIDH